jgi:D-arabinose 1-dehydrogenase-like Zn-dependent alcohol dehydrogenase
MLQCTIAIFSEKYAFEEVAAGYERMMSGKARFRVVINVGGR